MNKLALVGCGAWGKNYLPFVKPEYIKTRNYKCLFGKKEIDSVIIATPTETHFKIAKELLKHRFNLLIEKPITQNHKEALTLRRLSEKYKAKVMAGHILLYDEAYCFFKKLIKKIGQIKKLEFIGLQSPKRKDTTMLLDWGPHPIYIFIDIIKMTPIKTKVRYLKKILNLSFLFPGPILTTAEVAWQYPKRVRLIKASGKKGNVTLDYGKNPKKITFKLKNRVSKTYFIKPEKMAIENEITAFRKFVSKGARPPSEIDSAVSVMKIMDNFSRQLGK